MLLAQKIPIDDIYVPAGKRKTLNAETVQALAEDILENGLKTPVMVRPDNKRPDGKRHILVEGLHRLEAARSLGETEIDAFLVQSRKH